MDSYDVKTRLREFERRLTNCANTDEITSVRHEIAAEISAVEQQLGELESRIVACGDAREKRRLRSESAGFCEYLDGLESLSE